LSAKGHNDPTDECTSDTLAAGGADALDGSAYLPLANTHRNRNGNVWSRREAVSCAKTLAGQAISRCAVGLVFDR